MILYVSLESVIIFSFLINLPSLELLCLCVITDGRIPPFFEDVGALLSIQYHWLSEHAFSGCFLETIQLQGEGLAQSSPWDS